MFSFACIVGKLGIHGGCHLCNVWQLVETKMMHGFVESWVMFMIVVMHGCRVFCVGREQINIVRSVGVLQWKSEVW